MLDWFPRLQAYLIKIQFSIETRDTQDQISIIEEQYCLHWLSVD